MKKIFLFVAVILISRMTAAQNVGIGTNAPQPSALLELSSANKGFLPPRLTTIQRTSIVSPSRGLMVFDNDTGSYWYYTGAIWREINSNPLYADSNLITYPAQTTVNLTADINDFSNNAGYLYDSGGPAGNYGNNEDFTYHIGSYSNTLAIDVTIVSFNTESPYDSLILSDQDGHTRIFTGAGSNIKYRFYGDLDIRFKSNNFNTASGFQIFWTKINFDTYNTSGYDNTNLAGWYFNPVKMYMRGGVNFDDNWRPDSCGNASLSFNGKAKGDFSFSAGRNASANNLDCVAIGLGSVALGQSSFSIGYNNLSSGSSSFTFGFSNQATHVFSTAIGSYCRSDGNEAAALGNSCTASADNSIALGTICRALGNASATLGYYLNSKAFGCVSVGVFNDSSDVPNATAQSTQNRIFQIGNGYYSSRSNAMTVLQNGNIGIGELVPGVPLNLSSLMGNKISLFGNGGNHYGFGIQTNLMQMYTSSSGADIAFGYGNSNSFTENMRVKGTGDAALKGNFTVQNGKGLIRSADGTQKKELTTTLTVNTTFAAGETKSFPITWPESFSGSPDAYIGNITSAVGGWAEMIYTITNAGSTGANVYVYNAKAVSVTPNFTIKIIGIGPQ